MEYYSIVLEGQMKDLSNKETTLLGLLSEEPMHPYKIEQVIEERSMREWTEISTSSIYKLLRKLESAELIDSEIKISKNNLSQRVYSLTAAGREVLKNEVALLISEPEKMIYRVDLATSNLNQLTKQEALEGLRKYRDTLQASVKCYGELEDYLLQHHCPSYRCALARRPQYLLKGEIAWIEAYIDEIQESKEII